MARHCLSRPQAHYVGIGRDLNKKYRGTIKNNFVFLNFVTNFITGVRVRSL